MYTTFPGLLLPFLSFIYLFNLLLIVSISFFFRKFLINKFWALRTSTERSSTVWVSAQSVHRLLALPSHNDYSDWRTSWAPHSCVLDPTTPSLPATASPARSPSVGLLLDLCMFSSSLAPASVMERSCHSRTKKMRRLHAHPSLCWDLFGVGPANKELLSLSPDPCSTLRSVK